PPPPPPPPPPSAAKGKGLHYVNELPAGDRHVEALGLRAVPAPKELKEAVTRAHSQMLDSLRPEIAKYIQDGPGVAVRGKQGAAGVHVCAGKDMPSMVALDWKVMSKEMGPGTIYGEIMADATPEGAIRHEMAHKIAYEMPAEERVQLGVFAMDYFPSEYS